MFLKEIQMQGFKSFADRTKIIFDKGVTAVVGPNGSGKSNVTESLRWALGEASAKSLRGGKMPDVIFAGTEHRSPLNYAEVAVVLDNSDAFIKNAQKEIRVERHIYRNGDSDYLIDGKKVRLRDIHELFMDTGLGRDSFSIISQGRVEEIFNSKPEERRAIFEEAAGVLKYKTRKKETQTKLNQTQDNLDRLDDIIYELEHQAGPLERQAKTARQFLALDADRKQLQLDILVKDIEQDRMEQEAQEKALVALREDLAAYHRKRQSLEAENHRLKTKRQKLSAVAEQTQADLLELTKVISDLERQIDLIKLDLSQKQEKKTEASQRRQQAQEQLLAFQQEHQQKSHQLDEIHQALAEFNTKVSELSQELERFSSDPDQLLEALREDFVKLLQQEADMSNQLTAVIAQLDKESQTRENQEQEYQALQAKVDQLNQDTQTALLAYQASQSRLEQLLADYQELAKTVEALEQDYHQGQTMLFDLLDQKKAKEARRASLVSIQKNHSQFYAGVRAVLQAAGKLDGILGAVSEHLTFDSQYQTALEIALGASSQHIIVADEAVAKRAIAFLKANRQGRATFLPLTTIKARQLSEVTLKQLRACQGYLGTADSLVTYEPSLVAIVQSLLGVTAIFDTIDHANQAAKQLHYKVRIVTLDGTELRPGGAFSGGANRHNNTTFIKPELEQIEKELALLSEQIKESEKAVAAVQADLKAKKAVQADTKLAGEEARLAEQKTQLAYQQLAEKLADSKELLELLSNRQTDQSSERLLSEKARLEEALELLADEKSTLTSEIEQIKENKDTINQKKAQLSQELSQARLKERDLLNEKKFEAANQRRLETMIAQGQKELADLEAVLSHQVSQEAIAQLPHLENQLTEANQRKIKTQERFIQLRFEGEDYDARLEELEAQLLKEAKKNEEFIRQQARLEADLEQVIGRLRQHAKSLSEELQLSLEEAKEQAIPINDIDMPAARQKLQQIQQSIRVLGPINSDAIAQFDEVSERLTFLNDQRADLIKAKNLLVDTIGNMDHEVKARFRVTFEAIRDSFKETFRQMFGGGSADLMLTETDLLSAGVDISVQPPGKKLQSLNVMSGGEKALSALALLFAIIRIKTIPFVILDEVEAALDEANVKRFGDYLNRFDKDSQFIVVTHRKGTMAAADSIYGITMQESGVSKVVSVKLKDTQDLTYLS
ncbi:TPA: chromosome segregation protein SMC [Streptococcus equi subsp. zooepidemicus]|nr:chromosome segregation protein SMC [Streptococcus equi subsp. zooepidemicus]HEL0687576.1 chromosome segregation protein SMC [Streptococcus equi subsp. zooepidemicus]HEL0750138.1 chromosome segregation protein SMC [Streptococcus equi subsp. zooepidemicus]HEL0773631.1 chromosome segregation protein SMC [Streptococcus equi subsp. zooepidemicus]HEL1042106.1 chromosome segregation protein SMC [Streptococcus equi subsp. zooepidemicus]